MANGNFAIKVDNQEIIKQIDILCPFSGGKAVYRARAILAITGNYSLYDDETVCNEAENYRKAYKNQVKHNFVFVRQSLFLFLNAIFPSPIRAF